MEMPDATILSSRLPRVERKAMRPKRLIKPAKVSATVQLTNEISRLASQHPPTDTTYCGVIGGCRAQNIFQNFAGLEKK